MTSPVVTPLGAERATALRARLDELVVVVDHAAGVRVLAEAARRHGGVLDVLIDLDVGLGRTGSVDAGHALRLADDIAHAPAAGAARGAGLRRPLATRARRVRPARPGGAGHGRRGHHRLVPGRRRPPSRAAHRGWHRDVVGRRRRRGAERCATGVERVQDDQYRSALGGDADGAYEQSLFVQATVVSVNQPSWVTVDAGLKALATDAGPPVPTGDFTGCAWSWFGDEHGLLVRPTSGAVAPGEHVELVPPHCDPTVDRYDLLYFVARGRAGRRRGGDGARLLPVAAAPGRRCPVTTSGRAQTVQRAESTRPDELHDRRTGAGHQTAANGGSGSYSTPSWMARATSSPLMRAARASAMSIPAETPAAVMILPWTTYPARSVRGAVGLEALDRRPVRRGVEPGEQAGRPEELRSRAHRRRPRRGVVPAAYPVDDPLVGGRLARPGATGDHQDVARLHVGEGGVGHDRQAPGVRAHRTGAGGAAKRTWAPGIRESTS